MTAAPQKRLLPGWCSSVARFALFCLVVLVLSVFRVRAAQALGLESPVDFFTNVASRLLQAEFGMDFRRIQIYPRNEYCSAVHRLLQVSANLYDAATNRPGTSYPHPPSVFRPLFSKSPGPGAGYSIHIIGYEEVTNANQVLSSEIRWVDTQAEAASVELKTTDMLYGVPLVVGAKKGLPNFNEFSMTTAIQVTRALEFRRAMPGGPITETNEMYTLSISNAFGVEAWNSYSNAFPKDARMLVDLNVNAVITNELGEVLVSVTNPPALSSETIEIPAGSWSGYLNPVYAQESFRIPLRGSYTVLSNSTFNAASRMFVPETSVFERDAHFAIPQWRLLLRTRLRYALVDTSSGRILDYVNLDFQDTPVDIASVLQMDAACGSVVMGGPAEEGSMWCTNHLMGQQESPTIGIWNQIAANLGFSDPPRWISTYQESRERSIDVFRSQFDLSPLTYPYCDFYKSNVFNAPYLAKRTISYRTQWQANDPLVHYTVPVLTQHQDQFQTNRITFDLDPATNNTGRINERCEPWGGLGISSRTSPTITNPVVKDPMVRRSDDWDFPSNAGPSVSILGRVHRGTPWQTICLKSGKTDLQTWCAWHTPDLPPHYPLDRVEALLSVPARDWHLASVLAPLLNTNSPSSLLSVNNTDPLAWGNAFTGMQVWTNTSPLTHEMVILDSGMPQLAAIVEGIVRAKTALPNTRFLSIGDVLSAPELSLASPWLNLTNSYLYRVPEYVYEALPSQLLPLLRTDSIGSVSAGPDVLHLSFTGWEGATYTLESSTNLVDWVPVSTNRANGGEFRVEVTQHLKAGYYRSVLQ